MGIIDRFFGGSNREHDDDNVDGLTVLSGTTTTCRDTILNLVARHDAYIAGYLEVDGRLQRELVNPTDPKAVAVLVEGEPVGYLPRYVASALHPKRVGSIKVRLQIFTETLPRGVRAEVWAWLGNEPPRWEWSATNRPPMSSKAKALARHEGSRKMIREAIAAGGARAVDFERGMVDGVHYLELVEPIKQLKRDNRLEEALALCYAAIEGAEGSRTGGPPAPFYTEQAAIILRKLGRRDEEITVLKRWLQLCPSEHREGTGIGMRLRKLSG